MSTIATLIKHHNIKPDSTFDLSIFTEAECWDMAADETLTYDEADYMAGGITLVEAKAYIAASECNCEICDR